ncbi:MAG: phosphoenolpyruvate carboxykinase [Firmicutes bacterium]|nr:phosphoenolpyruvate carboxykinase [Bacillota bacterium]
MISEVNGNRIIIGRTPCRVPADLFKSEIFQRVLQRFVSRLLRHDSPLLEAIKDFRVADQAPASSYQAYDMEHLTKFLMFLSMQTLEEVIEAMPTLAPAVDLRWELYDFVEEFYDFWRGHERYLIYEDAYGPRTDTYTRHQHFIQVNETMKDLVLEAYRNICANLTGRVPMVYRQLPAGAGVGILTSRLDWQIPDPVYVGLKDIPFIQLLVIVPPLVYYPQRNYRSGMFSAVSEHPLKGATFDPEEWACYPAKVGGLLMFIYFHKRYLSLGTSLSNLFEMAEADEIEGKRPDAILLFGVEPEVLGGDQTVYYEDTANQIMVGVIGRSERVDYFGYLKKMALTLHNLIQIERGNLPIHGAMAHVVLRDGHSANIVLMGDSGAGKSESLEALRILADEHLRDLTVVFDDMGSLQIREGEVVGLGTEIGAFVRLDDLQPGYAYAEVERSIFMNPHKTNARIVIPITSYGKVIAGWPVDVFLYANNYERVTRKDPYIQFFNEIDEALGVCSQGARISKGTTSEEGLVYTYFANPFGAPQKRERHHQLARKYMEKMMSNGVKVGQLRTQLGIKGFEVAGPELAARALLGVIRGSAMEA